MSESVLLQARPEIYGNPVYLRGLFERIRHQRSWKAVKKIFDVEIEEMEKRQPLYESAALRAEIKKLTLLSDSQLANQERLTEELARVRDRIEGISRLDNAHPVTHALRLLADFNISVGKACEFIRHYMLDGSVDPITEEAQPYDEILDDVAASEIARRWRASEAELATERANQERLVGEMQELRQVVKEYKTSPKRDHRRCKIWEIGGVDTRCPTCVKADALLAKDIHTEPTCLCVIGCSVNGTCPIHGDDAIRAPYRTQERTSSGKLLIPMKWLQNETSWRISR